MPAVRPMLRAVGHGVPTAHGPKWADSCGSQWEQRVLLRPPVDEQLGRNALREVRESDHPMTAPDPLALAEEAERLANAATPGPWVRASNAEEVILSRALPEWEDDGTVAYETVATIADWGLTNWDADATFIARARELVPALAAALRAAHEENARLREALEEREGDMHLRIRAGYDKTVADSWRQENTRLREALGELVAAMERYENEAEGDAPQSHLDMMARVRSALAGGKGEG